ncbi:MAG: hypothetical protein ACRDHO_03070 [Actinomycetota bacterium]
MAAVGVVLGFMVHGLRDEVRSVRSEPRAETGNLRSELKDDIGALRSELKADIAELRPEIGDLRSDLTQVALAVGARPRAQRS